VRSTRQPLAVSAETKARSSAVGSRGTRWLASQRDDLVIFDREAGEFGWRSYLGYLYGTLDVPAYAAQARYCSPNRKPFTTTASTEAAVTP
jgi:hypothetical protein